MTQRGFTIVELVTVLVLLGILSAVAFSRFASTDTYEQRVLVDTLQTSLRLTQRTALSHHASLIQWRLNHTAANQWDYTLLIDSAAATSDQAQAAGTVSYSVPLTSGTAHTGTLATGASLILDYDRWGNFTQIAAGGTTGTVSGSLQLTLPGHLLCVSPTGFAYEGTCR